LETIEVEKFYGVGLKIKIRGKKSTKFVMFIFGLVDVAALMKMLCFKLEDTKQFLSHKFAVRLCPR
jgi:hypothetical protein